jgi:hypothetical protein
MALGFLSALIFANCGSDPMSGKNPSTATDTGSSTQTQTATGTRTDTGTPSDAGTGTDTGTDTGTQTGTGSGTGTGTPSDTGTGTDTRTSTGSQTQTTTATGGPDAGAAPSDAAPDSPVVTIYEISVAPIRKLDLLFMIDNSPSMAPKVAKMNAQFSRMLSTLRDPADGTYPDLRVAMIDSDLGTMGQYASGSCGPNEANQMSPYGDFGNFQMRGASGCGVSSADALWLEYTKGKAINYEISKDISQVFGCLATNLGSIGCGEEHQLQAFEFALIAKSTDGFIGRSATQDRFLRSDGFLGLVLLSDEDDCSAAPNDGMFGDGNHPELRGESASLRCATRSHMCSGRNLTDSPPGYPTTASFSTLFSNCEARTDACPNPLDNIGDNNRTGKITDTSVPTSCSPLTSIKRMADEMKALKANPDQVFVAGIFGWPRSDADIATAEYKIDLVPNPNPQDTAHPQVYDYWPVCYDPDHLPKSSGYDPAAWGWGAQGGLRLSAFIDEFGANGRKYSICEPDFSAAMTGIGAAVANRMNNVCLPSDYVQGKSCTVRYSLANAISDPIPQCTSDVVAPVADCWALVTDPTLCPGAAFRVELRRTAAEIAAGPLPEGTKIVFRCQ